MFVGFCEYCYEILELHQRRKVPYQRSSYELYVKVFPTFPVQLVASLFAFSTNSRRVRIYCYQDVFRTYCGSQNFLCTTLHCKSGYNLAVVWYFLSIVCILPKYH